MVNTVLATGTTGQRNLAALTGFGFNGLPQATARPTAAPSLGP